MNVFRTALKSHLSKKEQNMFLLRMNRRNFNPAFRYRFLFSYSYVKPGIYIGSIMALIIDFRDRYKKESH